MTPPAWHRERPHSFGEALKTARELLSASRELVAYIEKLIAARKPGEPLPVVYERRGARTSTAMKLVDDPRLTLTPVEEAGQTLTDAQRRFRDAWLSSATRNSF